MFVFSKEPLYVSRSFHRRVNLANNGPGISRSGVLYARHKERMMG